MSEETGNISLVVDGQIERGLDADRLRAQLRTLLLNKVDRLAKHEAQFT